MRHSEVWRGGSTWTLKHEAWLSGRRFDDTAMTATFAHYRATVDSRVRQLAAIDADLAACYVLDPFAEPVRRLCAYRGVAHLGALTLASEVCDWRRFGRASAFMGFTGLIPSEYSSGSKTSRGRITKAGNSPMRRQLIESAWAYQRGPATGVALRKRQEAAPADTVARALGRPGSPLRAVRRLAARKNSKNVVATAVARELCGFLWAEMTA